MWCDSQLFWGIIKVVAHLTVPTSGTVPNSIQLCGGRTIKRYVLHIKVTKRSDTVQKCHRLSIRSRICYQLLCVLNMDWDGTGKKIRRPVSSHLDWVSLVSKRFSLLEKNIIFLWNTEGSQVPNYTAGFDSSCDSQSQSCNSFFVMIAKCYEIFIHVEISMWHHRFVRRKCIRENNCRKQDYWTAWSSLGQHVVTGLILQGEVYPHQDEAWELR